MPRDLIAEIELIIANQCERIKAFILRRGSLTTPLETLEAEQELAAMGRQMADEVMEQLLLTSLHRQQHQGAQPDRRTPVLQGRKTRSMGQRQTPIRLLGGREVKIQTQYRLPIRTLRPGRRRGVGRRGQAGVGFYPHLVVLGILCGATPALLSEASRQSAESSSYQVAQQNLSRRGLDLNEKTLVRLTQGFGRLAVHLRQAQMLVPQQPCDSPLRGQRVAVSVDGGRLRVRQPRRRGRRRKTTRYRGFSAPWREPKLLVIYTLDDKGHKQRHSLSLYDATLGDANVLFTLLVGYLRLVGASQADLLVLLGDGARWIWDRVDELVRLLGIDKERFVAIVDFYHAVEHLRDVTDLLPGWSPTRRRTFIRHYKRVLKEGDVEEVVAAIDELCVGRNATALTTERDYFARNAERMRYQRFTADHLPIGSGAVESAVRQVVNQRLKSNGMFWLHERAEHVLHLRAFLRAGRWDQLVEMTLCYQVTLYAGPAA